MFHLICVSTNGSARNRDAGDLRIHRAHYDVIVMTKGYTSFQYLVPKSRTRFPPAWKFARRLRDVWRWIFSTGTWLTTPTGFWNSFICTKYDVRQFLKFIFRLYVSKSVSSRVVYYHDDAIKWKQFRVTGHLCGEFTGPRWIPAQRPVTRSFDVFFDLRLNKRLSKQSWGWWFEMLPRPLWRHSNAMNISA